MEFGIFLFTVGILAVFFGVSLRIVPSNPPHIAVVTFLGQRTQAIKEEGLRLFPFWLLYKGILISMVKETQQFSPQHVLDKQHNDEEESANLGRKLQTGASSCPVRSLAIVLNRLNVREVLLSGELLRDAGLSAREERQLRFAASANSRIERRVGKHSKCPIRNGQLDAASAVR